MSEGTDWKNPDAVLAEIRGVIWPNEIDADTDALDDLEHIAWVLTKHLEAHS
jgi:hypothetical protein